MKRMNNLSERYPEAPDRTSRGHYVMHTSDGRYIYCARCYVTRRAKDRRWLVLKDCAFKDREPCIEGETCLILGHHASISIETWRLSALRPRMRCLLCERVCWASEGFKIQCDVSIDLEVPDV